MGILKETADAKVSELKQNLQLPTQASENQMNKVREMNQTILQNNQQEFAETMTGLVTVRADQFEEQATQKYVVKERGRDTHASDRDIRRRAEKKTSTAVKLRKMLQELGNTGRIFDEIIKSDYTIIRLNGFNKKKNPGMSPADIKKYETLKKRAPKVYERLLKLEHVNVLLAGKEGQYPELCQFAQTELQQAQNEWVHVQSMAEGMTYKPTINKEAEKRQLADRRKPVEPGEEQKKDKVTELDEAYKTELRENLKPRDPNLELNIDTSGKKYYFGDEAIDYTLTLQMNKIKERDPSATPKEVKAVVTEYLKKLAESSELRFRVNPNAAVSILNSRYRSSKQKGKANNYTSFINQQFSTTTKLKSYEAISFGILGGKNAKEFSGIGGTDACRQYGTVSIKLKKDKMRGRATFTCGNSQGTKSTPELPQPGISFYEMKRARDVFGEPDISNCGDNLADIYFRAKELKENGYKDIKSAEQEALHVISDRPKQKYFEVQFHGQVGASEIEELTVMMSVKEGNKGNWDLSNLQDLEEIKQDPDVRKVYDAVNIVNAHPEEYGRTAEDGEMKVTLWDCHGNTLTFDDLKFIMEK